MARIIDEQGREITEDGEILEERFQLLDVYSDDGEAKPRRADWIGTISAGFRNEKGYPQASHDGTIYVSGDRERCAGLIAALAKSEDKRLTVAFLSDNLNDFIFQRFTRRSAAALEVYGDQSSLTEIKLVGHEPDLYSNGAPKKDKETGEPILKPIYEHITHAAGSAEYKALRKTCKVEVSVLFALAEWDGQRTAVTFPDGLGAYRIRFTSRNSLQGLVGKIEEIKARITRGRIAGVPFDLFLTNRDVPGPTGQVRNVPVWTIEFRPPEAIRLTSGNLAKLLGGALNEGQRLQVMLPAPRYDINDAIQEEPDVDLEAPPDAVSVLTSGDPPCDARYWESAWFVAVRGTPFASDDGRAEFLSNYTNGGTDSLSTFLGVATESEASALIAELSRQIEAARTQATSARSQESAARFRRISDDDDPSWQRTKQRDAERKAALEQAGFEPATEDRGPTDNVIDHEPEPTTAPAEKSKQRLNAERNYAQLITAASRLEIDLAPFEIDATGSDEDLATLTGKLAASIRAKTEQPKQTATA